MSLNTNAAQASSLLALETTTGVRFVVRGGKPVSPAATLFVFATDRAGTLHSDDYAKCGQRFLADGGICVSLDIPAHGDDLRTGEPNGLKAWRVRLDKKENFIAPFVANASAVLDHLIREGFTDPKRVAVAGTSRGGFCALHWAAAEPRVRAVVAFAPVTDLPVLQEFHGLENDALTQSLAARMLAGKLANRPIWICMGNNDQRVGTRNCFEFTQAVTAASLATAKTAPIEFHIMETEGHRTHATAHDDASAWLADKMK